jgi:hypothetical protein
MCPRFSFSFVFFFREKSINLSLCVCAICPVGHITDLFILQIWLQYKSWSRSLCFCILLSFLLSRPHPCIESFSIGDRHLWVNNVNYGNSWCCFYQRIHVPKKTHDDECICRRGKRNGGRKSCKKEKVTIKVFVDKTDDITIRRIGLKDRIVNFLSVTHQQNMDVV